MVARGGKTRLIGFICMVFVFSAVLYVFHETQVELDDVRNSASSCTHQLESLSSQLQGTVLAVGLTAESQFVNQLCIR